MYNEKLKNYDIHLKNNNNIIMKLKDMMGNEYHKKKNIKRKKFTSYKIYKYH